MTTVFPLRIAEGMLSVTPHGPHQSRTHRGIEQTVTTSSSVRQFFAAPSKTANSKPVSVTRADVLLCECDLIVEQNIPLAKRPATRNDFVNDIVDDARADAIFATLKTIVTCGRALSPMTR